MKAVVLLSGGLDSTTALYVARRDGKTPVCLTVHYGQLHEREISSAKKISSALKLEHWIVPISLPWGGSALLADSKDLFDRDDPTGRSYNQVPNIPIPKGRREDEIAKEIPVTYVPARNSIFLSLAASLAEVKEADSIYFGANALDYSGYPDCRPEFIEAFEKMITLGTKVGVGSPRPELKSIGRGNRVHTSHSAIKIVAPLLKLSKAQIVKLAHGLGVPFEWTWSCYEGKENPCGECDSCILREKGFREAGIEDPLLKHA